MQITLNGEKREIPDVSTVLGLLEFLKIQHQRVAVELNETIVKKERYRETALQDGDALEIVSFMGGGNKFGVGSSEFEVERENRKSSSE